MTPELQFLGFVVLFIVGGIATSIFHAWNRDRLNHWNESADSHIIDFIFGGVGTLIIFSIVVSIL